MAIHDDVFQGLSTLGIVKAAAFTLPGRIMLVVLGFAAIGTADMGSWAQAIGAVALTLAVGGTAAWAVIQAARIDSRRKWADYELEEKRRWDELNKESLSAQNKVLMRQVEAMQRESSENQEKMRATLHEIDNRMNSAYIQRVDQQEQLMAASVEIRNMGHELHIAYDRINAQTMEMERLRLGVNEVKDISNKVDRHVKQVAKAVTDSQAMQALEMDSDEEVSPGGDRNEAERA